ncbi:MAG: biotin--[acetyl-CoA-carboxylase] ligase [Anaerolineae bacterium]|nr:biotin--[acetyl-CoA-carboxylase] ligase [Anaerolineae bacterium]MCI0608933.1 biotin--[acetyl-CoA-carboxylase] ligase [Anaerolineae bacterium]
MNPNELNKALSKLPLGDIKYFESIGSTNDEALAWAANDAKDLSLVIADEQTAGRGRLDRKWFTPPGTALAFSLILRPTTDERPHLSRIVGLAALAVADALRTRRLTPQIKWPNDVLLLGHKVAGILVESVWSGEDIDCVVIGVGINVLKGSVPPADLLHFPATSLEDELGYPPDRLEVLFDILSNLIDMRPQLGTEEFLNRWGEALAFLGEQVQIEVGSEPPILGQLLGLESDGSLRLRDGHDKTVAVRFGDVRLRPLA